MQVTRISAYSKMVHTLEIDVTHEQLRQIDTHEGLIQNIVPNLSKEDREFLKTGITSHEWDEIFGGMTESNL